MKKEEFLDLNKKLSGTLSQERYLSKFYPEFYRDIINYTYLYNGSEMKERIWRFLNKDLERKICVCGNERKLLSISKGFQEFCKRECANKHTSDRIKKSKEDRYGDPNYNNSKKSRISLINNIAINGTEILKKRKKTLEEKYGDPGFTNREKSKITKKITDLENINRKVKNTNIQVLDSFKGEYSCYYKIYCNVCKITSDINNTTLNVRLRNSIDPCPNCCNYSSGKSEAEKEIENFIKSINFDVITNDRSRLDGLEIDILVPLLNIGFEYNGLYWHSEVRNPPEYHINKTKLAIAKGIKLIHIWEDDWLLRKDIVKSRIKNALKVSPKKIYARNCIIEEIDYKTSNNFLLKNHLQGGCPSKYNIGLFNKGELVALATFGGRKISGSKENELLRFCNILETNIIGGFSKILKYYINKYKPEKIITFADICWSSLDNFYTTCGFKFKNITGPNYYYIVEHKRLHRFNFRKDVLVKQGFDKDLSEKEIMQKRGIYRIYDCGNYKYEWINKEKVDLL